MPAVTFDLAAFRARYPEFSAVPDLTLTACFEEAGLYLSNKDGSPVADLGRRSLLLNMLAAHLAFVGGHLSVDGTPRPVGALTAATEGGVSVSFAAPAPGSGEWFKQSQYGAAFWQATSSLRGFRYLPCPTRY